MESVINFFVLVLAQQEGSEKRSSLRSGLRDINVSLLFKIFWNLFKTNHFFLFCKIVGLLAKPTHYVNTVLKRLKKLNKNLVVL